MTVYLLETYLPGSRAADLIDLGERLGRAADRLSSEGMPVRYLRATFVPEDETCFHYVEAPSVRIAERLAARAGLLLDRILETRSVLVSESSQKGEMR